MDSVKQLSVLIILTGILAQKVGYYQKLKKRLGGGLLCFGYEKYQTGSRPETRRVWI